MTFKCLIVGQFESLIISQFVCQRVKFAIQNFFSFEMSRFLWHSASHTGRKLLVHVTHSLPRPPPGVLSIFSYSLPVPIYTPKWRKALCGKSVSLRNIKADPILGQNPENSTRSSARFCISYGDDPEKHNKTNASLKNIIFQIQRI